MIIDSHCHLNYFPDNEIPQILERAKASGVGIVHTICTKIEEADKVLKIAESYDNVYASVGVHPNEASHLIQIEQLLQYTQKPKIISIGETGLDYHYQDTPKSIQKKSFQIHIEAARITGLPLVIHARDADDDMISILKSEYAKGKFKAVMHSFASSFKLCECALSLDFYISFSGIITFKNASQLQEIVKQVPSTRILIETDSPYLTPVPHRGKRNEPSFVMHVADKINLIKGLDNIEEISYSNTMNLFNKIISPT